MTTIIQNFTRVSLTSNVMLHLVELPFGAAVPFLPTHLSLYTLVSLCTCLPILDSSLSIQSEGISGYGNYLYFVHLSRNEIIISRASLDSMESEQLVRRNQTCSSLAQTSASSLVLVKFTG